MTDKDRVARLRNALIQYDEGQVMGVIPLMLDEYEKRWHPYIEQRDEFYKLFQKMENSNANYPFGYMTNYYFRDFERPTTIFYDGWSEFDEQNYHLLTDQEMVDLERKFRAEDITVEIRKSIQEIQDYVNDVLAKNAPIRRLKGMEKFYSELIAIRDKPWWYQKDLVSEMHPKQAITREEAHTGMGLKMPFHRELYIKLHSAYTTFTILKTKLKRLKTVLDSISSDLAFSELQADTSEGLVPTHPPKAFIAHGGESAARDKLENFLTALGVTPIIVEKQPSQGRSKDKNVEHYLKQCDCSIILATKGDIDGQTAEFIPRGNILIEIGRSQEILPDKMIYLLEEGAKFPTDIDEKVWERFTKESMDKAFTKIAKELRAFGLIRAIRPAG
jgi:predicted nucleotide-binding protein